MTRQAAIERISELRKSYAILASIREGGVETLIRGEQQHPIERDELYINMERPGMERPGMERAGMERAGMERAGMDKAGADRAISDVMAAGSAREGACSASP